MAFSRVIALVLLQSVAATTLDVSGKPPMALVTGKSNVQLVAEMGKVFMRSEETHREAMEKISSTMTADEAVGALHNHPLAKSSSMKSILGLVADRKKLRAKSDLNGFGGLDGARRLLNDMIYESSKKYDEEIAKCTGYYAEQCALMEIARGEISAANFVAAKSRALILDADANIQDCERDIPVTTTELKNHNRKCRFERIRQEKKLKVIMNDIEIMTMILKMSDCDAKLVQVQQLQLQRCQCGANQTIKFNHDGLQGQVDKLQSAEVKELVTKSFGELFEDDDDDDADESAQRTELVQQKPDKKEKDCKVTVYEQEGFKGWEVPLKQGAYTLTKLKKLGFKNDQLSSIKVSGDPSCTATLYLHDKYKGKSSTFPIGEYSKKTFTGRGGQDDAISSIIIAKAAPMEKMKVKRAPVPKTVDDWYHRTAAYPPRRSKAECGCHLKKSPRCYKIQAKFLQIQAEIEDSRDELMDEMSKQAADCKDTKDTLEASIAADNSLMSESQTKLATGMEKEASAGETGRQVAKENAQYNADLVKQMGICAQNYKDYEMEICALQKIRGDLFKKMTKGKPNEHNGFFQDCQMGKWTPEACTKVCAGGEQKIIRPVMKPAGPLTSPGAKCLPKEGKRKCNLHACPINCVLEEWAGWSKCSAKCGGGLQQRVRDVKIPMKHDGNPCAETSESRQCNVEACEKNCVLHPWTKWTKCSKDCDGGTKKKEKMVKEAAEGSGTCAGKWSTERLRYKACNQQRCQVPDPDYVMECHEMRDIVLLLDGTPKSGEKSWNAIQKQANLFVEAFSDAQFSIIHYTGPRTWSGVSKCTGAGKKKVDTEKDCHVTLAQHFDPDFVKSQETIKKLKFQPGSKLLSLALMTAESEFALGRAKAQSVVVVFMDGEPLSYRKTRIASRNIRKKARLVFVVLNKFAPLKDVKSWVTRRWQENLVVVKNTNEFGDAATGTHVVANICPTRTPRLEMPFPEAGAPLE